MNAEITDRFKSASAVLYIIPQEEETRVDLQNIDMNSKEDLRRLYRFYIQDTWQCNTIANSIIENIVRTLSLELKNMRNGNASYNFYDLIEAYVTVKRDENAEKEGNINIAFRPGSRVDAIIGDNTPREEREYNFISADAKFSFGDQDKRTDKMLLLDKVTRKELSEKYGIMLPEPWEAISIADTFLENIFRELVLKIVLTNKPAVSINFNDNIEFHAVMKSDGLSITMRPGMNAKLLIKSDELTEADEDDDEDD